MNFIVLSWIMVRTAVQETKLVSEVSKVSYILGYNYKNLRLKVSCKWFLKCGDLLQRIEGIGSFY